MVERPVTYHCKECGAPVERDGDEFRRECGHDEAGVVADLSATACGEGHAEG